MFANIFSKLKPVKLKSAKPKDTLDMDVLQQGLDNIKLREKQAMEVLDFLDIPHTWTSAQQVVPVLDLVKILSDEKKMKVIVSKLRNKAFW